MAEKEVFVYTYSAPRQNEVQKIREKYLPKEVTKLDQLRALDAGVTRQGCAVSLVHGILYSLVLRSGHGSDLQHDFCGIPAGKRIISQQAHEKTFSWA